MNKIHNFYININLNVKCIYVICKMYNLLKSNVAYYYYFLNRKINILFTKLYIFFFF